MFITPEGLFACLKQLSAGAKYGMKYVTEQVTVWRAQKWPRATSHYHHTKLNHILRHCVWLARTIVWTFFQSHNTDIICTQHSSREKKGLTEKLQHQGERVISSLGGVVGQLNKNWKKGVSAISFCNSFFFDAQAFKKSLQGSNTWIIFLQFCPSFLIFWQRKCQYTALHNFRATYYYKQCVFYILLSVTIIFKK